MKVLGNILKVVAALAAVAGVVYVVATYGEQIVAWCKKVLASLLSILVGLFVGAVVVSIVGLTKKNIGIAGTWDGIRLIFFGILAKGRDAAGQLIWGFNPRAWGDLLFRATPVIMTGLMPARRQVATATLHSGRGGSIIPTRPIKVSPCSNSSGRNSSGRVSISL